MSVEQSVRAYWVHIHVEMCLVEYCGCTNICESVCVWKREKETTALIYPWDGPLVWQTILLCARILCLLGPLQLPLLAPCRKVSVSLALTCTNMWERGREWNHSSWDSPLAWLMIPPSARILSQPGPLLAPCRKVWLSLVIKLQALVYDILPPALVFSYAIGSRKLS